VSTFPAQDRLTSHNGIKRHATKTHGNATTYLPINTCSTSGSPDTDDFSNFHQKCDFSDFFLTESQSQRCGATRNRWAASVAQFVASTDTTGRRGLFCHCYLGAVPTS